MAKSYFKYQLHKYAATGIIFSLTLLLLTGCGYNFIDSGQSLDTDDSRSLALGNIDGDGNLTW